MYGQPERALVFHCRSSSIQQKLLGIYESLLLAQALPFPLHLQLDIGEAEVAACASTCQCLFFVEAGSENLVAQVRALIGQNAHLGHQIVLIAHPGMDNLDLALRYAIGNILYEDRFDAPMLTALTRRLLGDEFFGFAPFFPAREHLFDRTYVLEGTVDCRHLIDRTFADFISRLPVRHALSFRNQASELIMNALAYGVVGITPEQRDSKAKFIGATTEIPPGKEVRIHILQDEEKYGISVKDPGGSLTLARVLSKLRRHTAGPGEILPAGVTDLTGRGLFLISHQTRLIFNIFRGISTEAILLHYFEESRNHYQSLIINEKVPASLPQAP